MAKIQEAANPQTDHADPSPEADLQWRWHCARVGGGGMRAGMELVLHVSIETEPHTGRTKEEWT